VNDPPVKELASGQTGLYSALDAHATLDELSDPVYDQGGLRPVKASLRVL